MARRSEEVLQKELEGVFRTARERADKELSGLDRAFRIRDQMLSNRSTASLPAKRKSSRTR